MSAAFNVAQYLDSLDLATFGSDMFVGSEPPLPAQLLTVTLYDTGGETLDTWAGYDTPTIQIRCRAVSYLDGYNKLRAIRDALILPTEFIFGDWFYTGFWIISDIAKIGNDDRNRELFTLNLRLMREPYST